jgi:hypothetical protein
MSASESYVATLDADWLIPSRHLCRLTFLALDDNEHGFSLRTTAIQAGGVIQALVAKSVLEVAPASSSVRASFPSFHTSLF